MSAVDSRGSGRRTTLTCWKACARPDGRVRSARLLDGGNGDPPQGDHLRLQHPDPGRLRGGLGTTRAFRCASSTVWVIWTRSVNSHTPGGCRPAASKAGHMTASDHAQQRPQRFPLPERPQMESRHPGPCRESDCCSRSRRDAARGDYSQERSVNCEKSDQIGCSKGKLYCPRHC